MKLVTYDDGRVGHVEGDRVDRARRTRRCASTSSAAARSRPPARSDALADVTPARPARSRKKFFHTAGNFREHHEESTRVNWSHPVLPWIVFFQNVDAIIGPEEPIIYPEALTNEMDYELELAVVIGKAGQVLLPRGGRGVHRRLPRLQRHHGSRHPARGDEVRRVLPVCKAIDTFCPIGPWIVTPDEIGDPQNLKMELRVNGESRQVSHSSRMSVTIPEIISHYSADGLQRRATSSPPARWPASPASPRTPPRSTCKPGDVVEAEIENARRAAQPGHLVGRGPPGVRAASPRSTPDRGRRPVHRRLVDAGVHRGAPRHLRGDRPHPAADRHLLPLRAPARRGRSTSIPEDQVTTCDRGRDRLRGRPARRCTCAPASWRRCRAAFRTRPWSATRRC